MTAASGTGVVAGIGDVGVDGWVTILGGSGLTIDLDGWNLGAPSWDSGVGDVGLEELGLGDEGFEEVKLKKDIVMLLLSVGLLFFVGVGLTAPAFGRLIFFFNGMGSIWMKNRFGIYLFKFFTRLLIKGC